MVGLPLLPVVHGLVAADGVAAVHDLHEDQGAQLRLVTPPAPELQARYLGADRTNRV